MFDSCPCIHCNANDSYCELFLVGAATSPELLRSPLETGASLTANSGSEQSLRTSSMVSALSFFVQLPWLVLVGGVF